MKRLSVRLAGLSALVLATCSKETPPHGEIAFNLNAQGPDGLYELCADFDIQGPVNLVLTSKPSDANAPCSLTPTALPVGEYTARLVDGWTLRLVGNERTPVEAELLFGNTRSVLIESRRMSRVVFRFRVNGVDLGPPDGSDAGVPDAQPDNDSGPGDNDAGQPDSGSPDSGSPDAGSPPICPALPIACNADWYADGECDPNNNFAACTWDGGDCCVSTCTNADCGSYQFDCRDPAAGGNGGLPPPTLGTPCAPVQNPFDPVRMSDEVALLSSDALEGRNPGFTGDIQTRDYIEQRFQCMGLSAPAGGCYQQRFANEGESGEDLDPTANVIGVIAGTDPAVANEIIVVGGHHDHLGAFGGVVYNGANDNASGVVALLAIAQQMRNSGLAPRRTVVFVAFGSEESGLEGAVHYVNNPPAGLPMSDVVYMINIDMLGTYDIVNKVDAFGTHLGTPGREILDVILVSHPDLVVNLGLVAPVEDSDYDPFCVLGIPHVYFETFDPPCWHEACDDASRIDAPHLAELTQILHGVVVGLANTSLDLAAARTTVGCRR